MKEKGAQIARIGCVVLAAGCVVMSVAKKKEVLN